MINNEFYHTLDVGWYQAFDHPVALLRAENALRAPWVIATLVKKIGNKAKVLDIGCGAGLLTNPMAKAGFDVTGIDISKASLQIATQFDKTNSVRYAQADAYELPFEEQTFEGVTAMDLLEHVEKPEKVVREAARVLKPGGLFFFHTFNRTFLSYLMVIKGVEWFVKNTPKNMHVYDLFIPPNDLKRWCTRQKLQIEEILGLRPKILHPSFWKMLLTRKVPENFTFTFCKNLSTGYIGYCTKL